jgi:hypothetical protein
MNPRRIGCYGLGGSTREVQVAGDYAYLADGSAGLEIIDVRNPASPILAANYYTGGSLTGLQLSGTNAFLTDLDMGLLILDVSQPANPRLLGRATSLGAVNGFQLAGSYAYVACNSGLHIIDVSNLTQPMEVSSWTPPGDFAPALSVHVAGHIAYVGVDRDPGIDQGVIDVTDPAHPKLLAFLGPPSDGWIASIRELGHYSLVADYTQVLKVYDNRDPTNLLLASTFHTASWAASLTVVGPYAYVSQGDAGVQVLDASNPTNLISLGTFKSPAFAVGTFVAGPLLYVAQGSRGLSILPSAPNLQFTLQVEGTPGMPLTIEAASDLNSARSWTGLFTTNSARMPFWFTDGEVKDGSKFYRVRQP